MSSSSFYFMVLSLIKSLNCPRDTVWFEKRLGVSWVIWLTLLSDFFFLRDEHLRVVDVDTFDWKKSFELHDPSENEGHIWVETQLGLKQTHLFKDRNHYFWQQLWIWIGPTITSLKGKMWVPLGQYPSSCFLNIPPYCPLETIYSRSIVRVPSQGYPHFSLWIPSCKRVKIWVFPKIGVPPNHQF